MKVRIRSSLVVAAGCSLVLAFLGQGVAFLEANGQTFDEAVSLAAGYSHLKTGDFRLNREHPPLTKALAALPLYLTENIPFAPDPHLWEEAEEWRIGRDFLYGSPARHDRLLRLGRAPNLFLGSVLVGLIGWWAYRLWGEGPALAALALASFDPNLIAHACVITPDMGLTLFSFLTLYLFWEYLASPSRWLLVAVGVSLGCALATKFSALSLVGILGAVLGLYVLRGGSLRSRDEPPKQRTREVRWRLAQAEIVARRILLIAFVTLSVLYFIYGFPAWGIGFRSQLERPATAAFFLGEHTSQGLWTYFPVAFLIKTPVGTLLLLLASLLLYRKGQPLGWQETLFLLVPAALFLTAMVIVRVNNGLRQLLPIYPFLIVIASRVATVRLRGAKSGWLPPVLVSLALVLTAGSSLKMAPHQLAYFNELVGGAGEGHRYVGDSNLDWGQDLPGLKAYQEREGLPMIYLSYFGTARPTSYGIRYQHLPGYFDLLQQPPGDLLPAETEREILAISVSNLQGIYLPDKNCYRWLAQRTPVEKIGESIYVYDLTGDADAHLRLAEVYRKAGLPTHAAVELRKGGGSPPVAFATGERPPP